jgi:hypothetical protein
MNERPKRRMPNGLMPVGLAHSQLPWKTWTIKMTSSSRNLNVLLRNSSRRAIRFGPLDSFWNPNISGHPLQSPSGLPKPSSEILNQPTMKGTSPLTFAISTQSSPKSLFMIYLNPNIGTMPLTL